MSAPDKPSHKARHAAEGGAAILAMTVGGKLPTELQLRDSVLRHALQLQRLSAGQQADADTILRQLEAELRALVQSGTLTGADKQQIEDLIASAEKIIDPAYVKVAAVSDTQALAVVVAQQTVKAIQDVLPTGTVATPERLASLTNDVLIDGAPSSAWWDKQSEDTAFRFAAAVRQGVVNGETNEKIVARIAGNDGFMLVSRRNARALVQSSVMAAANDARLATFRNNDDIFSGVRWLSTLDSHTCIECGALDGQSWDLHGKKLGGTEADFQSPPAHFACRCVLSGIPKITALEESFPGISASIDAMRTRVSASGDVPATTTFSDFLKRQSPEFVDEVLGKRRAELFLAGKLSLSDLISGTGRELTLEELT